MSWNVSRQLSLRLIFVVLGLSTASAFLLPAALKTNDRSTLLTRRLIFFKARDDKAEDSLKILGQLSSPDVQFPVSTGDYHFDGLPEPLSFRLLTASDISAVVDMCMNEYGPDWEAASSLPSDGDSAKKFLDTASLRLLIESTCKMKVVHQQRGAITIPNDHAILLATTTTTTTARKEGSNADDTSISNGESHQQLVGMIEVSRQPALPTRNPGPVPLPLWGKRLLCRARGLGRLQGWIANLLVAPEFRRKGVSKFLVAAAEGVARQWGATSIHLHCDANEAGGRIPRLLYEGMGYKRLVDDSVDLRWAAEGDGPNPLESSVYIIEGVPLLYLKKEL